MNAFITPQILFKTYAVRYESREEKIDETKPESNTRASKPFLRTSKWKDQQMKMLTERMVVWGRYCASNPKFPGLNSLSSAYFTTAGSRSFGITNENNRRNSWPCL